jgi:putative hydrolase of the HAD superfamily
VDPAIEAVLFDYGGVLSTSPFEAFAEHERQRSLPEGFIRSLNATNADDNAWARLERNEIDFDHFCDVFEAEARAAGGQVDARSLFASFSGAIRPQMVQAVRRCSEHFKTGLLTNNFVTGVTSGGGNEVLDLFDAVIESSVVGVRKPDPRFYQLACQALAIEPRAAVFLDDLGMNLKPARQLGMRTIKVIDPTEALIELEEIVGIPLR